MSDARDENGLPIVNDDAGDTPRWVPILGLSLLLVIVMRSAIGAAFAEETETAVGEATNVVVEVAAPDSPAD